MELEKMRRKEMDFAEGMSNERRNKEKKYWDDREGGERKKERKKEGKKERIWRKINKEKKNKKREWERKNKRKENER